MRARRAILFLALLCLFLASGPDPSPAAPRSGKEKKVHRPKKEKKPMHRPNRLAREKSPYLLQHKDNPVDWFPWGEEALERAKKEQKPIFLSIGYSTCHWCHVMERESFENEEIAAYLKEHFIAIKVDREERPDIDQIYMNAVQAMTGSGGWPLSVFLTPDRVPFFGGTYYPPEDKWGRPGFKTVLREMAKAWEEHRDEVLRSAERLRAHLQETPFSKAEAFDLGPAVQDAAFQALSGRFDGKWGGFGGAPKFPPSANLLLLLRHHLRTGEPKALAMVRKSLDAMADGGIYDHLGGGFHRYATDEKWLVPHFEKMLYDNALLARAYGEAYTATRDERYARVVRETLDYVLERMTSPEGGFYSAEDADSEGEEGTFYVWTPEHLRKLLSEEEARLLESVYGVTAEGNFEGGRTVLHVARPLAEAAREQDLPEEKSVALLASGRAKLFDARAKRVRPHRDDKVIVEWNGLMISAMAGAYQALGEERYLAAARKSARFILDRMRKDGRLLRRYRDGEAAVPAYLDDYAFLVAGLIDLYESDFDEGWLREAVALTRKAEALFWDAEGGGYYFTAAGEKDLIARTKEAHDGAIPSGNGVAALNLLRLGELTQDDAFVERARGIFLAFHDPIKKVPVAFSQMLIALDFHLSKVKEVVVAGEPSDARTRELLAVVRESFQPNRVVALAAPGRTEKSLIPLLEGRGPIDGKPAAFVCVGNACKAPVTDPGALRRALKE